MNTYMPPAALEIAATGEANPMERTRKYTAAGSPTRPRIVVILNATPYGMKTSRSTVVSAGSGK